MLDRLFKCIIKHSKLGPVVFLTDFAGIYFPTLSIFELFCNYLIFAWTYKFLAHNHKKNLFFLDCFNKM